MQGSDPESLTARPIIRPRVLYLTTTFPRFSETFLQREVRFLHGRSIHLEINSLWGGESMFARQPVNISSFRDLPRALGRIPGELFHNPHAFSNVLGKILSRRLPMVQNWLENFWGFSWAIDHASFIRQNPPDLIHATWGTMPAAAALVLHKLTGIPYSMEAHAYDVFKHGGDWLLDEKMRHARFIRTSTRDTYNHLSGKGVDTERLHLIRRGIELANAPTTYKPISRPLQILSVGRLIEKKDFSFQLGIFNKLAEDRFPFQAEIVGHGPLEDRLRGEVNRYGLGKHVAFRGRLNYHNVEEAYRNADVFLFTGKIAQNGDRDGLPNVIAEAMTHGLPVLTSPIQGALEAIKDGVTGFVQNKNSHDVWVNVLRTLEHNLNLHEIRANARKWIYQNFDIKKNGAVLHDLLRSCAEDKRPS
jgi:colanic acid/amylovoran biosynthesis glycosyltransferase